jgi:hypothetical protein
MRTSRTSSSAPADALQPSHRRTAAASLEAGGLTAGSKRPTAINVTWRDAYRATAVIRVDAVWLSVEPMDMRAGTEAAQARVVTLFWG